MSKPTWGPPIPAGKTSHERAHNHGYQVGHAAGLKEGARRERASAMWARVLRAGDQMSNICFNLKQNQEVKNEWRKSMDLAQASWDFALNGLKARAKKGKKP